MSCDEFPERGEGAEETRSSFGIFRLPKKAGYFWRSHLDLWTAGED
jgi:hypothetical protein